MLGGGLNWDIYSHWKGKMHILTEKGEGTHWEHTSTLRRGGGGLTGNIDLH